MSEGGGGEGRQAVFPLSGWWSWVVRNDYTQALSDGCILSMLVSRLVCVVRHVLINSIPVASWVEVACVAPIASTRVQDKEF